jgi:hypothetical protein
LLLHAKYSKGITSPNTTPPPPKTKEDPAPVKVNVKKKIEEEPEKEEVCDQVECKLNFKKKE